MAARSPYDPPPGGDFATYVERLSATPLAMRNAAPPMAQPAATPLEEVAEATTRLKEVFGRLREQAATTSPPKSAAEAEPTAPARAKPRERRPAPAPGSARGQQRREGAARPEAPAPTVPDGPPKAVGVNPIKYFVLPFIVAMAYPIAADFEPRIAPYETPVLVILFGRGIWLLLRDVLAEVRRRQQGAAGDAGRMP